MASVCTRLGLCSKAMLYSTRLAFSANGTRGLHRWQRETSRLMYWRSRDFDCVPHEQRPRSAWQNWDFKTELFAFSKRLQENFEEEKLRQAFTDKSYVEEELKKREALGISDDQFMSDTAALVDNEKLASDGETKIENFAKLYLRHFLPRIPEEGVRALSVYLISTEVLSDIASKIGCTDLVLCNELPPKPETLAKVAKALVGALLECQGDKQAEKFIIDFILAYLHDKDLLEIWEIPDVEKSLKKILENDNQPEPEARLLRETGRNTILGCYVVGLYVNKQLIGTGAGETTSFAREMAAWDTLRRFFQLTPCSTLLKYGPKAYERNFSAHSQPHCTLEDWRVSAFTTSNIQRVELRG